MNAHDGLGPRDARVRELVDQTLEHAMVAVRVRGEPEAALHRTMEQLCDAARGQELRAEQLLVLLKQRWRVLPVLRRTPSYDAELTLERVVTECIHRYYAAAPSP